jgi:catechol 2,3-dioxygenase-like lactoylglutathione lyase family enzyme
MTLFEPLGIDHVVLRTADQDAARRFYIDVLGCTLEHVNERISLVHLRFGDQLIDLLPAGPDDPPGSPPGGRGLDHFCLSIRCADLAGLRDHLVRQGVPVEGEVAQRRGAYGTGPSLYLRDLDGYRIELKPR